MRLDQYPTEGGVVLFKGESGLDGKPVVVIATLQSSNVKTGNMIQTWFLRSDISPIEAVSNNEDVSICGDCKHRGSLGKSRSCYVNVGQAPLGIWRAFQAGKYKEMRSEWVTKLFGGRRVRLGSYGDPSIIPYEVLLPLVQASAGWTGYTHQWSRCDQRFRSLLMASVDSPLERHQAILAGWRTFRVRGKEEPLEGLEIACPASPEGGERMRCEDCLACSGTRLDRMTARNAGISIIVHGSAPKLSAWSKREKFEVGPPL